ncbi:hypothetical protein COCON_G00182660 [Conger conger]|uniref:G-patch domain and KOW motifs-containing protein n=1 Tax=Conger conger TaxID=82655 RepID=A0A9Q1D617_CONCO|nr:G-patch domain and KOW motifs-containing protein [Conger conger]KAJ8259254.1 hypothetical protein COCON_G00182660 [Conger conger]
MASEPDNSEENPTKFNVSKDEEDKKVGPISFGFSKTLNKLKTSSHNRDEAGRAEERDYLTGVEGKELKSTKPVEKAKELVIPLINKNRWYRPEGSRKGTGEDGDLRPPQEQDSVESQAVKELIEESLRRQEQWDRGEQADPNLSIPLLMQNQAPDGLEDGDQVKVDLRPESSTAADYDSVPVEAYGMAMLKGMGWKEGEGIGRTFKQDVKPIEHQLRPKGLGLGADRSALKDLEPAGPRRPPKPGQEKDKDEEALVLGPGGCVLVQSGAHKDLYGKIEGLDPDNARLMVKLAIGGKTVTVSQYAVQLVARKDYDKNSKDLSRLGKAHKEKEKEKEKKDREREKEREEQRSNGQEERRKEKHSDRERDGGRDHLKRKHQEWSGEREKPLPVKEPRLPPPTPSWLQRDLRVRFIDKAFKGGKYYNSKMRIEDVLSPDTCVCRTEEGRLLDDVKQRMLETVVPRKDSDFIMVVQGKHRGQVGRILQRDREKAQAMVQLERDEERVHTLDYDSVCHYLGAVDN